MQELTEERLAKLPKWAQQHVQLCYANIRYVEKQAEQMTQGPDGSKVRLVRFTGDLEDQPLPDRTIIAFDAPTSQDGKHFSYIEVSLDTDGDGVYVTGAGSALVVEPSISNCITVRFRKRP